MSWSSAHNPLWISGFDLPKLESQPEKIIRKLSNFEKACVNCRLCRKKERKNITPNYLRGWRLLGSSGPKGRTDPSLHKFQNVYVLLLIIIHYQVNVPECNWCLDYAWISLRSATQNMKGIQIKFKSNRIKPNKTSSAFYHFWSNIFWYIKIK